MRTLVIHPHSVLRKRAEPVAKIDASIEALVGEMIQMMHDEGGIGLAAPQVGVSKRIFVTVGESQDGGDERVFINPKFRVVDGVLVAQEEGCLSLPDIRGSVRRQPHAIIEAMALNGESFTMENAELMARCWQHEVDHLDGVLIIDRMSPIDRLVNRKRLRALEAAQESE